MLTDRTVLHLGFDLPPDLDEETQDLVTEQIVRLCTALDALHRHAGGSGLELVDGEGQTDVSVVPESRNRTSV